jgi:hypothetical protein
MNYCKLLCLIFTLGLYAACQKIESPECYTFILGTYEEDNGQFATGNVLIIQELAEKDKVLISYILDMPATNGQRLTGTVMADLNDTCNELRISRQIVDDIPIEGWIDLTYDRAQLIANASIEIEHRWRSFTVRRPL